MWLAKRQQLIAREQACDAYVLSLGITPTDYAEQLINIAKQIVVKHQFAIGLPMAQSSQTKQRIFAILNFKSSHMKFSRTKRFSSMILLLAIVLFSAAFQLIESPTTSKNTEKQEQLYGVWEENNTTYKVWAEGKFKLLKRYPFVEAVDSNALMIIEVKEKNNANTQRLVINGIFSDGAVLINPFTKINPQKNIAEKVNHVFVWDSENEKNVYYSTIRFESLYMDVPKSLKKWIQKNLPKVVLHLLNPDDNNTWQSTNTTDYKETLKKQRNQLTGVVAVRNYNQYMIDFKKKSDQHYSKSDKNKYLFKPSLRR